MTIEHVTLDPVALDQKIGQLVAAGDAEMLGDIARMLLTELQARHQRYQDAWKLLGRCDMAFELITEAKLLGPAKRTAKQLRAEIKKASGG